MSDARAKFSRRKLAYVRTFCGDQGNLHVNGELVLEDLKKFCGMTKPGAVIAPKTGAVDPYASIYRAAQRDVYLHISGLLGIDIDSVFKEPTHEPATIPQIAES